MRPFPALLAAVAFSLNIPAAQADALTNSAALVLVNHQPFPIRMPFALKGAGSLAPSNAAPGAVFQSDGSNVWFVASLAPGEKKSIPNFETSYGTAKKAFRAVPAETGLRLEFDGKDAGTLSWDVVLKPSGFETSTDAVPSFNRVFEPMPLQFHVIRSGPVFDSLEASAQTKGLDLSIHARAFHAGFLEVDGQLRNQSAVETSNIYAAAVCRWDQPNFNSRTLCYDNHISALGGNSSSPFRRGEGRHQFIQRGTDWVRTEFFDDLCAAWLNNFDPSFTIEVPATAKTPAHYAGANLPQLGQETQTKGDRLYLITEIARSNIRSFRDRLKDNILPPEGESVSWRNLLALGSEQLDERRADELFTGWTSYNRQTLTNGTARVSFGVDSVRFGTSYFPYSTLGENFDDWKLPGMDREGFWPLAADTVTHWQLFADDIRRDLRIAKSMGFQLIRLHHFELLAPIDKTIRRQYLDFLFGELRHLQLKALLDIYASPEEITDLLSRYGDVVDGVEIENEVLIWGIPLDRPTYWNSVYDAVKAAAPNVKVNLTGYNNTGMFNRLNQLGVKYDRVSLHSYIDTLAAIPSGRGYALALASYASAHDKTPIITEWNWRGLTRMTEAARAQVYPGIMGGAVGTRGIRDFYQFQFNETLCANPRTGRGNVLRHYELLHLSRRPKLEAFALMNIIQKYSSPHEPLHDVRADTSPVVLDAKGRGEAKVTLQNNGDAPQSLWVTVEGPAALNASLSEPRNFTLSPRQERALTVRLKATDQRPGYYHCFLRIEGVSAGLKYAEIEASKPGIPAFDGAEPLVDWSLPVKVLYGANASSLEVETAIAIAETLEAATGKPVEALPITEFAFSEAGADLLLFVGTPETNERIPAFSNPAAVQGGFVESIPLQTGGLGLAVTGRSSREVEQAGMNFILSYWKNARDSAAGKIPLVRKDLPRGINPAKLP
ncbi:MAG TPA: hypothetical protein VHH88_05680 [Verrucomicrobiae bacterium]|nr:hypothetical protein [Verrucomicrobiae bacterium]